MHTIFGATLRGVHAEQITVEVDLNKRLPGVSIVGLPASAVRESTERIRCAFATSGELFPRRRVVINLAPADRVKRGTSLDLAMALSIWARDAGRSDLPGILAVGELSLDGRVRGVAGTLAFAELAQKRNLTLVIAKCESQRAARVPGVRVVAVTSLREAIERLTTAELSLVCPPELPTHSLHDSPDLADVNGHRLGKRALEIAAAGGHHMLLMGPPGCGKSLLAKCLAGLLPLPSTRESLEICRIHDTNIAGAQSAMRFGQRPFRAPHHSISTAGLIGDRHLRAGEVCLAHRGVLFLDEATEVPRRHLDLLREPMEDRALTLRRAAGSETFPCATQFVFAANPCPCGRYGGKGTCSCGSAKVTAYQSRLSGPLLDRIDIHIWLAPQSTMPWSTSTHTNEHSAAVRARVQAARDTQQRRGQRCQNVELPFKKLNRLLCLRPEAISVLQEATERGDWSTRRLQRVLRVARTIADLESQPFTTQAHVLESITLTRPIWSEGMAPCM